MGSSGDVADTHNFCAIILKILIPKMMSSITEVLQTAPALIAYKGTLMVEARKVVDLAKLALKVAKAKAIIGAKHEKNQMLIEAKVQKDPAVLAAEDVLINAQKDYELSKIAHEKECDKFISARKLGGMDDKELEAIRGGVIYENSPKES